MDRTSKTRVLTAYDVMTANKRAHAAIIWLQNEGELSEPAATQGEVGVELMTQELFALLTEDEYDDICDKCVHGEYCAMATFGGHNPKITACCKYEEGEE